MRFTLYGEGSSDRCLVPLIEWLLLESGVARVELDSHTVFFDKSTPLERIFADPMNWTDLLFVHRDADSDEPAEWSRRKKEIQNLIEKAKQGWEAEYENLPHVPVIPVQETEAWLLISEIALLSVRIKKKGSSKNPTFPGRQTLEGISNPKRRLCGILRDLGCEIGAEEADAILWQRIMINLGIKENLSYGILRGIPSFVQLENAVKVVVSERFRGR